MKDTKKNKDATHFSGLCQNYCERVCQCNFLKAPYLADLALVELDDTINPLDNSRQSLNLAPKKNN